MGQPARSPATWRRRAAALPFAQTATLRLAAGSSSPTHGRIGDYGDEYCSDVNRCSPAPRALDRGSNRFFGDNGRCLVRAAHGAILELARRVCVERPYPGAFLAPLAVARDSDAQVITCPS